MIDDQNQRERLVRLADSLLAEGKSEDEVRAAVAAEMQKPRLPAPAPADRSDQTIRNPGAGPDPAMRGLGVVAKAAPFLVGMGSGAVAGNVAARGLAKAALPRALQMIGSGAVGGVAGGSVGRGAQAVAEGRNPLPSMKPSWLDAAIGGGVGAVGAGGSWLLKKAGATPKRIVADKTRDLIRKTSETGARTPDELLAEVQGAGGKGLAVTDVNPQLRSLGRDVAKRSPVAEQALEEFADTRKLVPAQRALEGAERALGTKAANLKTTTEAMREALRAADDQRFNPLFAKYPAAIKDPDVSMQVKAILNNLSGARGSLTKEQAVLLKPVAQVLDEMDDTVTLQGLHRLKVALDKAASAPTTTSDAAMGAGAYRKAAEQLKELALKNVAGGDEYLQTLAASEADRAVIDMLEEGHKAFSSGTTVEDVVNLLQKHQGNPRAIEAYRAGALGDLKHTLGENPSLSGLRSPNAGDKFKALAKDPASASKRAEEFADLEKIELTNRLQQRVQPPTIEGVHGDPLSGQFGTSNVVGQLLTGDPTGAVRGLPLPLGSLAQSAVKSRAGRIERGAYDEIAKLLKMDAGQGAAARARELLTRSDVLAKIRARRAGTVAGAVAGGSRR